MIKDEKKLYEDLGEAIADITLSDNCELYELVTDISKLDSRGIKMVACYVKSILSESN
ncbi:hypothetical protein QEW_4415 [Clostridioides difficile CD160]|nr:hypothetical protein QEW_4415 [Clostridioides difficile CD160]